MDNARRLFKPGMIGSLELRQSGRAEQRLTVPLAALVRNESTGGFAVFIPNTEGNAMRVATRAITIGKTEGVNVEVISGLSANERVVVVGAQTLHNNDVVRELE